MAEEVKLYPRVHRCDELPRFPVVYSDIVRDDDFKRVQEDIRHNDLMQDNGSVRNVYDYQDGKVPDNDPVTDVIMLLRSGKLDRADVQKLKGQLEKVLKDESDKYSAEEKSIAERALAEQRQKYLDEQTGFVPETSE